MPLTSAQLSGLAQALCQATSYDISEVWLSLHSGSPGGTGANEITSGTGADGRQQITFTGSAGVENNSGDISIDVAGAETIPWVGFWTAQTSGTFLAGWPLAGQPMGCCAVGTDDDIIIPAHGLEVNDVVRLYEDPAIQNTGIPTGFTTDTQYWVVTVVSADLVNLSATESGDPITPSSSGQFVAQLDGTVVLSGAGTITFPSDTGVIYEQAS